MISPVKIWRSQKNMRKLISKEGVVVSYTMIRVPSIGFTQQAPYPVVLVRLQTGKIIVAQMVDWQKDDVRFGAKVMTVVRKITEESGEGIIPYGIKVKPI